MNRGVILHGLPLRGSFLQWIRHQFPHILTITHYKLNTLMKQVTKGLKM